ncbi:DUF86 domain-containing protein, partial [Bacillus vallismortis]|nr:DUF86 domain-containing protein [Bacillus vallismortis]
MHNGDAVMYFVDRNKIEQTLGFFERQLALFNSQR